MIALELNNAIMNFTIRSIHRGISLNRQPPKIAIPNAHRSNINTHANDFLTNDPCYHKTWVYLQQSPICTRNCNLCVSKGI